MQRQEPVAVSAVPSRAVPAPPVVSSWVVSRVDLQTYAAFFNSADKDGDGLVGGESACVREMVL